MTRTAYVFDTFEADERTRLEAQTEMWDAFTSRRLTETGIGAGWRCLEVGAGTGSVAAWLLDRVAPGGHVVATDLVTRWLEPLASPHCEVRRHDVVTDPLETAAFDLVHVRLVLMHLPERDTVLEKLAAAVRPGGWLVIDDYFAPFVTEVHPPDPRWTRVAAASLTAFGVAGADIAYGHKVPDALDVLGLVDVDVEGAVHLQRAPVAGRWLVPILERLRETMVRAGDVDDADVDAVVGELLDERSELRVFTPVLLSTRGRRREEQA